MILSTYIDYGTSKRRIMGLERSSTRQEGKDEVRRQGCGGHCLSSSTVGRLHNIPIFLSSDDEGENLRCNHIQAQLSSRYNTT